MKKPKGAAKTKEAASSRFGCLMLKMVTTCSTECGLDVEGNLEIKSLPEVAAQPDHEDTSISEHTISIRETPSYCCR